MLNLEKSKKLHARALEIIPGGTNTNAKRIDNLLHVDFFPAYLERGEGAYVWDLDGNRYIDYIASLAPIVIGHQEPRILARLKKQLDKGTLFSLPSSNEVKLSELLIEKIPCAEMVKLMKTGAEVTSAAVRAARFATGREKILSCEYHGWHDWWSVKVGYPGIPQCYRDLIRDFKFNDFESLKTLVNDLDGEVACIVLTAASYGVEPENDFLPRIRKLCDDKGIVLIFDEIITGFRWAIGGAQQKYGVTPDLAAFGKAMANGMPIAALVGKKEIMAYLKDTLVTSTFASEALSIEAALETIQIIEADHIIDRLYAHSNRLRSGIGEIAAKLQLEIDTLAPTPAIKFEFAGMTDELKRKAQFELIKEAASKGILLRKDGSGVSLCVMAALSADDIDYTLDVLNDALAHVGKMV